MNQFMSGLIGGLVIAGTMSLVALGLTLIYRSTDTFNFAHGQFMLLAAFLVGRWQADATMPFFAAAALSVLIVGTIGAVLYQVVLRRTVGRPMWVPVMVTLGFASIADSVISIAFGPVTYNLEIPGVPTGVVEILSVRVQSATVVLTLFSFALALAVALVLRFTELGARARAAGQNALLASQSGIHVNRVYVGTWITAAALAATAGIVYGGTNVVEPGMVQLGLLALPAMILGGFDSVFGAILGSVVVGLIQGYTAAYWGGQYTQEMTYALLLVILLVRPQGFFGTTTITKL